MLGGHNKHGGVNPIAEVESLEFQQIIEGSGDVASLGCQGKPVLDRIHVELKPRCHLGAQGPPSTLQSPAHVLLDHARALRGDRDLGRLKELNDLIVQPGLADGLEPVVVGERFDVLHVCAGPGNL